MMPRVPPDPGRFDPRVHDITAWLAASDQYIAGLDARIAWLEKWSRRLLVASVSLLSAVGVLTIVMLAL